MPFPRHLQMAAETAAMVHQAIDAYGKRDAVLARDVIERDDVVDQLFDEVKEELLKIMNEHLKTGKHANGMQLLDMLMIAKYFERSADHATNIAESQEYAVTGQYKGETLQ